MLSFFSNQPYDPSPPDASPGSGSIVRQPPASIIHWQVPEVVQLTIGSSEPLDCRAKPPSPASASPSEVKSSSAGAKPSSKPPIARESSAESASPPPSASWEEAVSSGDPPPRGFLSLRPVGHQRAERHRQDGGQKQLENLLGGLRRCAHVILPRCAASHGVNVTTSEGCLVPTLIKCRRKKRQSGKKLAPGSRDEPGASGCGFYANSASCSSTRASLSRSSASFAVSFSTISGAAFARKPGLESFLANLASSF